MPRKVLSRVNCHPWDWAPQFVHVSLVRQPASLEVPDSDEVPSSLLNDLVQDDTSVSFIRDQVRSLAQSSLDSPPLAHSLLPSLLPSVPVLSVSSPSANLFSPSDTTHEFDEEDSLLPYLPMKRMAQLQIPR